MSIDENILDERELIGERTEVEIKLDKTEISNVFSNGITKLVFNEKTTAVKKEDTILYSECALQIE